ncbi:MAG: sugar transferase [Armatimonadota bacterium]
MVINKPQSRTEYKNRIADPSSELEAYLGCKIVRRKYRIFKRIFDILLSLFGIIVFSPVVLIISIAILIEDGPPVLFRQPRMGLHNKVFNLLKFRSMRKGAEKGKPVLAEVNDSRITGTGKIIRSMAFDEMPQLINILRGQLSFVGPRPERPELVEEIIKSYPNFTIRNIVKPGLTGMAQVYGNYDSCPYMKLKYDLFYIQKWNFWLDIKLLFKSLWITFQASWNKRTKRVRFIRQKIKKVKNILK